MEDNTGETNSGQDDNPQHDKQYPGFAPDPQSEINGGEFLEADPNRKDEVSDEHLAEKGPIRNPNYHNLDDEHNPDSSANRYRNQNQHAAPTATDGKTLEDFNDTDPKRDTNKANVGQDGSIGTSAGEGLQKELSKPENRDNDKYRTPGL